MNMAPYAFAVVSYVHDTVAGERLNCALFFYSPEEKVLRCLTSKCFQRLEQAFGRFVRQQHERVLSDLEARTEAIHTKLLLSQNSWPVVDRFGEIVNGLLPDQGLSYQASPFRFGLTANAIDEAEELFARFVESQRPPQAVRGNHGKRIDSDVWKSFQVVAKQRAALRNALQPVKLRGKEVEFEFKHAVKNGSYHVVQPVSFDMKSASAIADKAAQWVGKGVALQGATELAQIFLLVGRPNDPGLQGDFQNALEFLDRGIPVKHEIINEDEVEQLADKLEKILTHT